MTDLADYGIQNEKSDVRVHVCPKVRRIYVFPTVEGRKALSRGKERPAYQDKVAGATASGYTVPIWQIDRCVGLVLNETEWNAVRFSETDDVSTKGHKAAEFVAALIKKGVLPLPFKSTVNANLPVEMEIAGQDIRVIVAEQVIVVQVKCDYEGGAKVLGGSGNLYLQTAERNPLKIR